MPDPSSWPAPASAQPVFVAAALRSGSTLMALMLDRNPAMLNPGEFDFLFDSLGVDGGLAEAERMSAQDHDQFLVNNRIYQSKGIRFQPGQPVAERIRRYVAELQRPDRVLTLNIHRNFRAALALFPQARFVHLVRDPRDCARSAIGMGWAGNVFFGTRPWLDAEQSWERVRPLLAPEQFIELHYETLVSEPAATLERLCCFLGVPYTADMLDLAGTSYSAPSAAFANQWRKNMPAAEVRWVERSVGALLAARGYPAAAQADTPIGRAELMRLKLHNRSRIVAFQVRRYGLGLWAAEQLTRKLGWQAAARRARARMIEIDRRWLK